MALAPGGFARRDLAAIGGLALAQIIGWGTTYHIPAILAEPIGRDLGLSREVVFGGVTLMLLVAAAASPKAGVLMDRGFIRPLMVLGSALMATALVVLAGSGGPAGFVLGWLIIGFATPLALSQGALAAVARIAGGEARRAIGLLMLMSGFASSVAWPVTAALDGALGWRLTCLIFAGVHLAVCLPIHAMVGSLRPVPRPAPVLPEPATRSRPVLVGAARRRAFILAALAFSLGGFVSWGLPLHAIAILQGLGLPAATAILVASLIGPAQVSARFLEMAFGSRTDILSVGLLSAAMMPLALLLPLVGGGSVPAAVGFTLGYGLAVGAITIVRAVAPLVLFGPEGYATTMGRLAVPQNIAFASSPLVFATIMGAAGPVGTLSVALLASLLALAAMAALAREGRG